MTGDGREAALGVSTSDPLPTVAVIIPVHNREREVRHAIDSVLAQTYPRVHLIVVDDGSSDGTSVAIAAYGDRITALRQEHLGAYAARNAGLRVVNDDLIAFLDSDDTWTPDRLDRQVPLFRRPEVGLVFGNASISGTRRTTFDITPPRRGRVAAHFAWGNFISTSTVVVRREALAGFSEQEPLSADYLAWFRIALEHDLDHVDEVVAAYRVHVGGISYELGPALETRIRLFQHELSRTSDRRTRRIIRRILFHLSVHLWVAIARRRSTDIKLASQAMRSARIDGLWWLPAFLVRHSLLRARRVFA